MKFTELKLAGAYEITLEPKGDERGFFARYFCEKEFGALGLETHWVQMNTSLTCRKGTVRGLHFQLSPKAEVKVVRCLKGKVFDVIVDLRKSSKTFGKWLVVELDDEKRKMVYVPKGFAHGFQTLTDDVEMFYMHSEFYAPECEGGMRYDDPQIGIAWPLPVADVSERDRGHALLESFEGIVI